ncbi:MAG: 30S ribosomal protein S1 [Candidatus Binatia bacterium]
MANEQSPRDDDFAALFAESEAGGPAPKIAVGDVVRGRVVVLGQSAAFVAIGAKGEAMIDLAEFRDPESGEVTLAIGDVIEATVTDDGARSGSIVLRRSVGRGSQAAAELEQAMAHRLPVEGVVSGENKGGFDVQIGSVRAFCPASQIDRRRGDSAQYIGQRLRFHVTRVEGGGRNVVLSRRQLLDEEASAQATETVARLAVGATVTGQVTSLREFGAFVDLGGVEGMIHISELGHSRVKHPGDVLAVGQTIEAQVTKIEPGSGPNGRLQIGLSLRALAPDPWSSVGERFAVGATVRGTVRKLEAFGAFIELAPGLDGLVHVSKLALDRRVAHPRQVLELGQEVEVTVLAIDAAQRRMSLSMVERARGERDAAQQQDHRDEQTLVSQVNEKRSLGTFADLLSQRGNKGR